MAFRWECVKELGYAEEVLRVYQHTCPYCTGQERVAPLRAAQTGPVGPVQKRLKDAGLMGFQIADRLRAVRA